MGLPPEAAAVIGVIRGAEGTAAGDGYLLFGGTPFTPGTEHPARYGWQGSRTEYGPTHAAGPGQWQPKTWDGVKERAKAQGIDLDFSKGSHQDWAIWSQASRVYQNATGRDLAGDVKAGTVDYKALGSEWQGLLRGTGSPTLRGWSTGVSPFLQERANAIQGEADRMRAQYHADAAELMRQANAAPPGSRERDEMISQLRERERRYLDRYEQIASHPPAMKPVDALENFGSAGTIVALIGGLFARRHMTAALGAAGKAMQAINQNRWDEYQREYKIWEQQSATALNMVKLHNEEIRSLIDDKKMAVDEKNSRLQIMLQGFGMQRQADQIALGASEKVFGELAGLERAHQSASQSRLLYQQTVAAQLESKYIGEGIDPTEAKTRAMREAGLIPGGGAASARQKTENDLFAKLRDEWVAKEKTEGRSGEVTPTQEAKLRSEASKAVAGKGQPAPEVSLTPETLDAMAEQYLAGDRTVVQNLGRGAQGGANVVALREAIARKAEQKRMSGPEIANAIAAFSGLMAEHRTAGNRQAALAIATEVAREQIPLVRETSKKVNRTEFPTINRMIVAFQKGTGDPVIVQFLEQLNTLKYTYARALNPTGVPRVADLERFDNIISEAWSKGQIDAALDQIERSLAAEKTGLQRAREGIGGQKQGGNFGSGQSTAATGVGTQEDPAAPKSKDEYLALPKGTWYLDADGKIYQKQSDAVQ